MTSLAQIITHFGILTTQAANPSSATARLWAAAAALHSRRLELLWFVRAGLIEIL
jgi:hypothetical protein